MTPKQQKLIQHVGGKRGYNTDSLNSQCQDLFGKHLNDLNRVEASRFIKHLINSNGLNPAIITNTKGDDNNVEHTNT
jgi:hypothetical protein